METRRILVDTPLGDLEITAGRRGLISVSLLGAKQHLVDGSTPVQALIHDGRSFTPHTPLARLGLLHPGIDSEPIPELPPYRPQDCDPGETADKVARDMEAFCHGRLASTAMAFDYPVDMERFGEFRRQVTQAMRAIPPGEVRTYGWIARTVGRPYASRAVGAMVGSNPFGIVVPCHRVVGAKGHLTGYGGGLALKVALLALEQRTPQQY